MLNIFGKEEIKCKFAVRSTNGVVAERLGSGLQNRLPRFESGRCLKNLQGNLEVFLCNDFLKILFGNCSIW